MKREFAILKALIRDFHRAIRNPKIARMVLLPRRYFQVSQVRAAVLALVLNNGNIHGAVRDLRENKMPEFSKFVKWADKVKGGAS